MISVYCPGCGKPLQVDESRSGKLGKCRRCGSTFRVPGDNRSTPSTPELSVPPNATGAGQGFEQAEPEAQVPRSEFRDAPPAKPPGEWFPNLDLEESRPIPPGPPAEPAVELIEDEAPLRRSSRPSSGEYGASDDVDEVPRSSPRDPPRTPNPSRRLPRRKNRAVSAEEGEDADRTRVGQKFSLQRLYTAELGPNAFAVVIIAGVGAALLWIVFTPLAFLFRPLAVAMLIGGCLAGVVSRLFFRNVARQELGPSYPVLRFVPFYDFYFFATRIRRMLVPFVFWLAGFLFVSAGCLALLLHRGADEFVYAGANFTPRFDDDPDAGLDHPQRVDAEAARLLGGRKQEARAWLRQTENRRNRELRKLALCVDRAYKSGATEVDVVGFDAEDDEDFQVIVTLPVEPAARRRFFTWYRTDIDPDASDIGQKYLFLLDLDPD